MSGLRVGLIGSVSFSRTEAGAVERSVEGKLYEHITPEDFGAVADWNGTTGTDNYTAFVRAISAAVAARLPLRISGRYYVEFSTGRDRLSVSGDLVVCGTSKELSEIKFGPANVGKDIRGFDVASSANFTIRDLKLSSPALSAFPLFDGLKITVPIWFSPNGTTLTVERCYFGDQWYGLQVSGAGGTRPKCVLKDSYFQGYNGAFLVAAAGAIQGRVEAINCVFQGHQNEGSDWAARGHCMYPHPHFSLVLTGCRFYGSGRSQINHFSSSGVPNTTTPPEIISLTDCYFGQCIAAGIHTSDLDATAYLTNCVFDDVSGVSARCNVVMNNCEARNGGALVFPYNSDSTTFLRRIVLNQCRGKAMVSALQGVAVALVQTKDVDATSLGTLVVVIVNGGHFQTAGASVVDSNSPQSVYINDATFEWISGTSFAVFSRVANIRIESCRFVGAYSSGSAVRNTGTGTFDLIDNEFNISTAAGSVVEFNAPVSSVTGENNRILGASMFRAQNAQNMRWRKARYPSTVASAATIVLDQNYDYFRVSGSTAISRIRMGGSTDDYNRTFSDTIKLVVDAAGTWSLANTANIVPISTAARSANEVLELYYDSAADKWYEV